MTILIHSWFDSAKHPSISWAFQIHRNIVSAGGCLPEQSSFQRADCTSDERSRNIISVHYFVLRMVCNVWGIWKHAEDNGLSSGRPSGLCRTCSVRSDNLNLELTVTIETFCPWMSSTWKDWFLITAKKTEFTWRSSPDLDPICSIKVASRHVPSHRSQGRSVTVSPWFIAPLVRTKD